MGCLSLYPHPGKLTSQPLNILRRRNQLPFSHVSSRFRPYISQTWNPYRPFLVDGAFEHLRGDLATLNITLNTSSNDEHIPEIERFIRTLKERTRCIYNSLPFQRFPPRIRCFLLAKFLSPSLWVSVLGLLLLVPPLICIIIVNLTCATYKPMKNMIFRWHW
jgi:hypothetical protein